MDLATLNGRYVISLGTRVSFFCLFSRIQRLALSPKGGQGKSDKQVYYKVYFRQATYTSLRSVTALDLHQYCVKAVSNGVRSHQVDFIQSLYYPRYSQVGEDHSSASLNKDEKPITQISLI